MLAAFSVGGVRIRLTLERWRHIVSNHPELDGRAADVLDAVGAPSRVVRGHRGSLIAQKNLGKRSWLWVYYKEMNDHDGFIITALLAGRPRRGKKA